MSYNQPMPWQPTNENQTGPSGDSLVGMAVKGGRVGSGDWCQGFVSFRTGSAPVVFATDHFLFHFVYVPDADDGTFPKPDTTPATFGGPAFNVSGSGAVRHRQYRIDPGVAWQAPWDGQVSIIAGGKSPNTCMVDVVFARGLTPRHFGSQEMVEEAEMRAMMGDPRAMEALANLNPTRAVNNPRMWPSPVVGTPQIVSATWIGNPIAAGTPIALPDGAFAIEVVDQTGTPGNPIPLTFTTMGTPFRVDCSPGIPRNIAAMSQGGIVTNGTPATWSAAVNIGSATVYSKLGC